MKYHWIYPQLDSLQIISYGLEANRIFDQI